MRIFVTGASGLLGKRLVSLLSSNHHVIALTRNKEKLKMFENLEKIQGDVTKQGSWQDIAATCDAIVHLAGAGVMDKPWSPAYKDILRTSRIDSTRNCAEVGAELLISASATGIYGDRGAEALTETSERGNDFLSVLASDWEKAAKEQSNRVVIFRFGIVLDSLGGALKKMKFPFQCFVGGPIGSGQQYWPWIHYMDACNMIARAIDSDWSGAINAVAPQQVTCNEFVKTLGKVINRPAIAPMPTWILRLVIGERSDLLISSQRVIPQRLQELQYEWKFPTLYSALDYEYGSQVKT